MYKNIKIMDMTEKEYEEYVQDEIRRQIKAVKKGIKQWPRS